VRDAVKFITNIDKLDLRFLSLKNKIYVAVKGMTNHTTVIESENTIKFNSKIERIHFKFISQPVLRTNIKKIPIKTIVPLWAEGCEKK